MTKKNSAVTDIKKNNRLILNCKIYQCSWFGSMLVVLHERYQFKL